MSTRTAGGRRAWTRRASIAMTLCALACANVLVLAAPATAAAEPVPAAASAPSWGPSVRYYVVGAGVNGQREYLFAIAAKTLGNGHRYLEIYALNQGRVQPDGQRLTDPAVLAPGWVLQLPADATGPDVHFGPLPNTATGRATAPSRTPAITSTVDNAQVYNVITPAGLDTAVRTIALATVVIIVGLTLRLLRRGTRATLRRAALATAAPPGPAGPPPNPPGRIPTAPRALVTAPAPAMVTTTQPAVPTATATDPPSRLDHAATPETAVAEPPDPVFRTQVTSCGDVVDVRLVGARGGGDPPYYWVRPGDPFPAGAAVVAWGTQPHGELFVDLTASPDVITVTGPPPARLRQALSLARQLHVAGVTVIAVGDVLGRPAPAGCRSVTTWDGRTAPDLPVVVFHPGPGDEAAAAVRRTGSGALRPVLVLVGDVRRARWSIDVQPPGPPRAQT